MYDIDVCGGIMSAAILKSIYAGSFPAAVGSLGMLALYALSYGIYNK